MLFCGICFISFAEFIDHLTQIDFRCTFKRLHEFDNTTEHSLKRYERRGDIRTKKQVSKAVNKRQRIPNGQSKWTTGGKLATQDTQHKLNKNTTQYVLDTTIRKQTQIT